MTARPRHHRSHSIAILLLIPLLASCGGLLSSPPKRQLYRVNPALTFPAGLPHVSAQLVVAQPTAPAGLDTERIALSRAPLSLDYFADAQWADRMPFLVQTALVEGFEKSAAIPAVGPDNGSLSADFVLETSIGDFEAIYDAPDGPPRISVALDAKLVRMPARRIVAQISVSREAKATDNAIPQIVAAFDSALGGAVTEIVTWTLGNHALSERRGSVLSRTRFVQAIGSPTQ
ncbi:MAG: ABC-type transport auxiliary lipoprotein family protein [Alphaproteobacteria bacterium]